MWKEIGRPNWLHQERTPRITAVFHNYGWRSLACFDHSSPVDLKLLFFLISLKNTGTRKLSWVWQMGLGPPRFEQGRCRSCMRVI